SQKLLEREVAKVSPRSHVKEGANYIDGESLELRALIREETLNKLRRAQDLVSQSANAAASLDETLSATLDLFLERQDPVKKAERALVSTSPNNKPFQLVARTVNSRPQKPRQ